jgi:ferredoxin
MTSCSITIDGHKVEAQPGETVLAAARKLGLDIPTLCYLEKCGPMNSCLVCLVKINGKLVPSCGTKVQPGMMVESETDEVHEARRTALELLFSDHVGDCLSPCNLLCPLHLNIPAMLAQVQAGKLDAASATLRATLPLPGVLGRLCHHPCEQACRRGAADGSAAIQELERFVADTGRMSSAPALPPRNPATGKSVVIVGSGPTGLAAAYYLLRLGHACTIADRHPAAGGSLRAAVVDPAFPQAVLVAEIQEIERLGAHFKLSAMLGHDITLDGLLRGFDAVLLALGEISKAEGEAWGLEMVPGGIKVHTDSGQTSRLGVFAAGRAVKPLKHLVRAMSEGQAAAECIHQFLAGNEIHRPHKPFSSVMGRLAPEELNDFVKRANPAARVTACDLCAGYSRVEAATESARCLHCECASSGNCALQTYAQLYGANPGRFHHQRRKFESQEQPGGVVFEPGKCIRCGICVRLTELAREPLGLAFIGRGFDVRVATPFNGTIEAGLQKVADECVQHCPTGALTFARGGREKEEGRREKGE